MVVSPLTAELCYRWRSRESHTLTSDHAAYFYILYKGMVCFLVHTEGLRGRLKIQPFTTLFFVFFPGFYSVQSALLLSAVQHALSDERLNPLGKVRDVVCPCVRVSLPSVVGLSLLQSVCESDQLHLNSCKSSTNQHYNQPQHNKPWLIPPVFVTLLCPPVWYKHSCANSVSPLPCIFVEEVPDLWFTQVC